MEISRSTKHEKWVNPLFAFCAHPGGGLPGRPRVDLRLGAPQNMTKSSYFGADPESKSKICINLRESFTTFAQLYHQHRKFTINILNFYSKFWLMFHIRLTIRHATSTFFFEKKVEVAFILQSDPFFLSRDKKKSAIENFFRCADSSYNNFIFDFMKSN